MYTNFGDSMKKIIIISLACIVLCSMFFLTFFLLENKMANLDNMTIEEIKEYAINHKLNLTIKEEYSLEPKGTLISQSIEEKTKIKKNEDLIITISLGLDYKELGVNELGNVPIMMYHGIVDSQTDIDKAGYNRSRESFINDLEFYYKNNYRMIRLVDYVNGIINVKAGLSPIILTFDDGLASQFKVTGLDSDGNIIIDPNCAVGILEAFKTKYPDFNVTATIFVNGTLFRQSEYNEKILKWLVENGYDVGNHSYSHADFTKIDTTKSVEEIGKIYDLLDKYIPGKYVNIVALPYGSPYKETHENFASILTGTYNDKTYQTISTLRVGWESEKSPFNKDFNPKFLKRIRAYDNNGTEFDISMNFKILEKTKYISDGDSATITVSKDKEALVNNVYNLKIITY